MLLSKIILLLTTAWGGNGYVVGNGGNTVTCPPSVSGEIFSQQTAVLDVFEGKFGQGLSYTKLVSFRSQPLEIAFPKAVAVFLKHSPWRTQQVMGRFANRSQNLRFVSGELPLKNSSLNAALRGCTVEQAAIQYTNIPITADAELKIDVSQSIWNGMGTDQKIALLMHEYILKDYLFSEGICAHSAIHNKVGFVLSDEAVRSNQGDWNTRAEFHCYNRIEP